MTKVDFYILQSDSDTARINFTCRLTEKALRQGNKVRINVGDDQTAKKLDDSLWRFSAESYLPHQLHTQPSASNATGLGERDEPIVITVTNGKNAPPPNNKNLLLNLDTILPNGLSEYQRFAQIVDQDNKNLDASRQIFKSLKDEGYEINVNKLAY